MVVTHREYYSSKNILNTPKKIPEPVLIMFGDTVFYPVFFTFIPRSTGVSLLPISDRSSGFQIFLFATPSHPFGQWSFTWRSSLVTAAGPRRTFTVFPYLFFQRQIIEKRCILQEKKTSLTSSGEKRTAFNNYHIDAKGSDECSAYPGN